jgi:hypothetical protein
MDAAALRWQVPAAASAVVQSLKKQLMIHLFLFSRL